MVHQNHVVLVKINYTLLLASINFNLAFYLMNEVLEGFMMRDGKVITRAFISAKFIGLFDDLIIIRSFKVLTLKCPRAARFKVKVTLKPSPVRRSPSLGVRIIAFDAQCYN